MTAMDVAVLVDGVFLGWLVAMFVWAIVETLVNKRWLRKSGLWGFGRYR